MLTLCAILFGFSRHQPNYNTAESKNIIQDSTKKYNIKSFGNLTGKSNVFVK